jgi:hypothetical protein
MFLEELNELDGTEYDAFPVNIGDKDQFSSGQTSPQNLSHTSSIGRVCGSQPKLEDPGDVRHVCVSSDPYAFASPRKPNAGPRVYPPQVCLNRVPFCIIWPRSTESSTRKSSQRERSA